MRLKRAARRQPPLRQIHLLTFSNPRSETMRRPPWSPKTAETRSTAQTRCPLRLPNHSDLSTHRQLSNRRQLSSRRLPTKSISTTNCGGRLSSNLGRRRQRRHLRQKTRSSCHLTDSTSSKKPLRSSHEPSHRSTKGLVWATCCDNRRPIRASIGVLRTAKPDPSRSCRYRSTNRRRLIQRHANRLRSTPRPKVLQAIE